MPKLSVWFIRSALLHMGIGFLFGTLILHHKGIPIYPWTWKLLSPHITLMIFGWTIQFVMGVAFWILPRFSGEQRYGWLPLGWFSFVLLNSGIVLMALGGWLPDNRLSLVGILSVLGAVGAFIILMWPRVKPLGGLVAAQKS